MSPDVGLRELVQQAAAMRKEWDAKRVAVVYETQSGETTVSAEEGGTYVTTKPFAR